jgi:hypothetical protein
MEPGQRSQYSDWLGAGRAMGGVRVLVESKFVFSPRRPDRLWAQPPIQWVPGLIPWGNAVRA